MKKGILSFILMLAMLLSVLAPLSVYADDGDASLVDSTDYVATDISEHKHILVHVPAKAPTAYEDGNIEYWYCDDCGYAWLDELCTLNTTLKAVVLPATGVQSSEGLEFTLNANGTGYVFAGIGNCTDTEIVIPAIYNGLPVTAIDDSCFAKASKMTSVVIPEGIISIGSYAFENSVITEITIPNSVTSIGEGAFAYCTSLQSITVAENNAVYHAAGNCLIETASKTLVVGCKNSVIPADGSVTAIASNAFRGMNTMTALVIPEGITTIGTDAFYFCTKLTEIALPASVTAIGVNPWPGCRAVTAISVDANNPVYIASGNAIINKETKELVSGFTGCVIPADGSVTSIGSYAFLGFSSIKQLDIPDSIQRIESYAFSNCTNLTGLVIPVSVTYIGKSAFNSCSALTFLVYEGTAEQWAAVEKDDRWASGAAVADVTLVNATGSVGLKYELSADGTYYTVLGMGDCTDTELVIPAFYEGVPVTAIAREAFKSVKTITSVSIPASIKTIGYDAFWGCTALKSVYTDNLTAWCRISFGGTFSNPLFYAGNLYVNGALVKNLAIPSTIQKVLPYAFIGCDSITSVKLSTKTTTIGNSAFQECSNLASVSIPSKLTSMGRQAFSGCRSLKSFTFPTSLKTIGERAFNRCSSLVSISIPQNVTSIGAGVFSECSALESIEVNASNSRYKSVDNCLIDINNKILVAICANGIIPADGSVTEIGVETFSGIPFTAVTIPSGVTTINSGAFSSNGTLTTVTLPASVMMIGTYAFAYSDKLTSIVYEGSAEQWEAITKDASWNAESSVTVTYMMGSDHTHSFSNWMIIGEVGQNGHYRTCSCGLREVGAHEWGTGEITLAPTETTPGVRTFTCSVCPAQKLEEIPATGSTQGSEGLTYTLNSDNASYTVTGIGTCTDTELVIPAYYEGLPVTVIGSSAFSKSKIKFTSVVIPNTVTTIKSSAFNSCSITSLYIPSSVTNIELRAFGYCNQLTSIVVDENNPVYFSAGNCIIEKETKTLIAGCNYSEIPADGSVTVIGREAFRGMNRMKSIVIPEGITEICSDAFHYCTGLMSINIPASVTVMGHNPWQGCQYIESITVDRNNTVFSTSGNCVINKTTKQLIAGFNTSSIPADGSVTSIGSYAFYNAMKLPSIDIPDSVTSLGAYAFYNCDALTIVSIPVSVTNIDLNAFILCNNVTVCIYEGTPEQWAAVNKNNMWVHDCGFTDVTFIDSTGSVDLAYELTADGTYMVLGLGDCKDTDIVIPALYNGIPVTSITENAFLESAITSITIPATITSIGAQAFRFCFSLKAVYIENIISWCGITFGSNLANPLAYAGDLYLNGELVTDLVIPSSVTALSSFAFYGCTSLVSVDASSVSSFGGIVFSDCKNLERITLSTKLTEIPKSMFLRCKALKSIKLPTSLKSIGMYAFMGSGIESIVIPKSVTGIHGAAFANMDSLRSFTVNAANTTFKMVDNCLINLKANTLVTGFAGCTIPADGSVTKIGSYAFYLSNIESIVVPDTVTSIDGMAFDSSKLESIIIPVSVTNIGSYAFSYCNSLKTFTYKGTAAEWEAVTKGTTWNLNTTFTVTFTGSAEVTGELAYELNADGTAYTVTGIGTFNGTDIVIPATYKDLPVTAIAANAFNGTTITSITLPASISYIGKDAFWECESLKAVYAESLEAWCSISFENHFANPVRFARNLYIGGELLTQLVLPDSITTLKDYVFYYCSTLTSADVRNVTSFGTYTFSGCSKLKNVILPSSLERIEKDMFSSCSSLTSFTIPASVTYIGMYAFDGSGIESIYIPKNVKTIAEGAFNDTAALNSIVVDASNETYRSVDNCLIDIKNKRVIAGCVGCIIPADGSVTSIGPSAFRFSNITSITIPNTVVSILRGAFFSCEKLTSVYIPVSVTEIGQTAFRRCTNITSFVYEGTEEQWNAVTKGDNWNQNTTFTVTFGGSGESGDHTHTLVKVEAKAPTCSEFGNIEYWYCLACDWVEVAGGVASNLKVVQLAPAHALLVYVAAKAPTCSEFGNIEYWYCKSCDWVEVAGGVASNLKAVQLAPAHALVHVAAKAPTCSEFGNLEYWYCKSCDWVEVAGGIASNLKAVQLAPAHALVHVAAKAPTCSEFGNIEYWYCKSCDWVEVAGGVASNLKAVQLAPAHALVHVAAKAPTCFELGNIEYWYCSACDWVEVAGGIASNLKVVQLPINHSIIHVSAKAATATENGNVEYWYCDNCGYAWLDEKCTLNTNLMAVIIPALGGDAVVYGDVNGDGKVNGRDVILLRNYMANFDYDTNTSTVEVHPGADANGDGKINGRDVILLRSYMANYDYDTGSSTVVLGPNK